jgi:drug/metabolite transporter (DMT)-like permease
LALADTLALGWRDVAICLLMGAVQIGLGSFCYVLASRRLPAAQLTLLALLEVVLGSLWVWIFLAEAPTGIALAGGLIVLGAAIGRAFYEMGLMRRAVV